MESVQMDKMVIFEFYWKYMLCILVVFEIFFF